MTKNDNIQKNNNIHDNFFKSLFSVKENLADLLQGSLPQEVLCEMKLETLVYDLTEYIDQELAPYNKDISCNIIYGDTNVKISLLYDPKIYPSKNPIFNKVVYLLSKSSQKQAE